MKSVLIGAPVFQRAWCLPAWFDHVEKACVEADVAPQFVFVGDAERDPDTWAVIAERADQLMRVYVTEETRTADVRDWALAPRFHRMVELRNALLDEVRAIGPEWFLSLDSDILLHPQALVNLLESVERFDAVGGRAYMSPGTACPSYGSLVYAGGLHRPDFTGVAAVDVIMAVKLMTPLAYAVDYEWHHLGEDIGWSVACRRVGLTLGFDGRVAQKHLMDREALNRLDPRAGF